MSKHPETTSSAMNQPAQAGIDAVEQANPVSIDSVKARIVTPGERWFDRITYGGFAGGVTFVLSVVSGYLMQHGESKAFFGLSKHSWSDGWKNITSSLEKHGQMGKVGVHALQTVALSMGGTLMVLPITLMERSKKSIVKALNKVFGNEDDVALGNILVENQPTQSLGTMLKGRLTACLVVLGGLTGTDLALRATKRFTNEQSAPFFRDAANSGLNAISERSGSIFQKAYEHLVRTPTEKGKEFWQNVGKISALDAVATAAAAALLYVASKTYSRKHQEKKAQHAQAASAMATTPAAATIITPVEQQETHEKEEKSHRHTITPRGNSHREAIENASLATAELAR
jgi:hypothetical protein